MALSTYRKNNQVKDKSIFLTQDESWFLSQLCRATHPVITKGRDFAIICPFHDDTRPSCNIDRMSGVFNCFACSEGSGHWNKLADKLGMDKLETIDEDKADGDALASRVRRAIDKSGYSRGNELNTSKPIIRDWSVDDSYRGFGGKFLNELGCLKMSQLAKGVSRLCLPVRNGGGGLLGYTCRYTGNKNTDREGNKILPYMPLSPKGKINGTRLLNAKKGLFLLHEVIQNSRETVVLTEGPFDALRLFYNDIPAVAVLGTENWSSLKAGIIAGLGFDRVIIVMDGDRAGRLTNKRIKKDLAGLIPDVSVIKLNEGEDPDSLSTDQIEWLRNKILG